jgi:hypothetical protein
VGKLISGRNGVWCRGWAGLGLCRCGGCLELRGLDKVDMLRNNWLPIKSLIVASSWTHLYLLIKDARSFEHKVWFRRQQNQGHWTFAIKTYALGHITYLGTVACCRLSTSKGYSYRPQNCVNSLYHSPVHTFKCYSSNTRDAKYPFCNTFFTVYSNSYLIMWPTRLTIFRLKIH